MSIRIVVSYSRIIAFEYQYFVILGYEILILYDQFLDAYLLTLAYYYAYYPCFIEPDPDGLCDGTSVKGWWEGTSQSWTSIDQCTNNDIRAGIQMIYYYSPQNLQQPDQV